MAQPLTKFWPIFPSKSDGQEVVNQKSKIVRNGPSEQQLNRTPNEQGISDYYRMIEKDDPKHVDWRKKLGGMLLREVGGKKHEDKWNQCILHDFPEGYRLFEHVKMKTNSGANTERQDAYLYGYPKGPKKRFRSPIEFFPHLLWLSTDEEGNYQNCTCRICSPLQMEVEKPALPPMKVEIKPEPITVGRDPVVQIPLRRPSTGTNTPVAHPQSQSPAIRPASVVPNPSPNPMQIRAPERKVPTPLSQPRSIDQQIDSLYNRFIARTGEVVWFFRPSKAAWGLGVVARRYIAKDTSRTYLVQPLSHPYDVPPQELVTDQIKPWLAWSAPSCTYSYLQQNSTFSYAQVDWQLLLSGRVGDGIADVDASILASKAVDTTYTLAERLKTTVVSGVEHHLYNCIYLGGEKIWNGEPVRLRLALGTDIMVVTAIIEKIAPGSATPHIMFTGDVYSYKTAPVTNPAALPQPPTNPNSVPLRMREDMKWRNQLLIPETRQMAYWDLVSVNATVDIAEVKGRWYETSILYVEYFKKAVKTNEGGNGVWMNARGDATGSGKIVGTQYPTRVAAFGAAVPRNLQFVEGLEPPEERSQAPATNMQGLDMSTVAGTGDQAFAFDDFMNLDGAGDAVSGFDQAFNFG